MSSALAEATIFERVRTAFPSATAGANKLEQFFQTHQRRRAGSNSHFERSSTDKWVPAAISNVSQHSVFEEPSQAMSSALAEATIFERIRTAFPSATAEANELEQLFQAHKRRRAGSNSHFERSSTDKWVRAAISSARADRAVGVWCEYNP